MKIEFNGNPDAHFKELRDSYDVKTKATTKNDGWQNVFSGLGVKSKDQGANTVSFWMPPNQYDLEATYAGEKKARVICDDLPSEATREFVDIIHPDDGLKTSFRDYLDTMCVPEYLFQVLSWARLYGGACLLINTKTVKFEDLSEPLDENTFVKEGGLAGFTVFNRYELTSNQLIYDPSHKQYGYPEFYQLVPKFGGTTNFKIHHSRLIRFDGEPLPRHLFISNNYWHDSVLSGIAESLRNYANANNSAITALNDFSIPVLKIKNLAELVSSGQGDVVRTRIEMINLARSVLRVLLIDDEEQYETVSRTLTGVSDLLDRAEARLVGDSRMPRRRLLGESTSGLGNEGKGDDRNWYDQVRQYQEKTMRRPFDKIFKLIQLTKDGPTGGKIIPDLTWDFKNLWQTSKQEDTEIYAKTTASDKLHWEMGTLTTEQIARARFPAGKENESGISLTEEELDDIVFKEEDELTNPDPVTPEQENVEQTDK